MTYSAKKDIAMVNHIREDIEQKFPYMKFRRMVFDEERVMTDYSNQINQPAETSIAYGQTKEQANAQVQERNKAWWEKVSDEEFMQAMRREADTTQFKVRHPFIK